MDSDTTTPDTRLADDPAKYNPAQVTALRQLMVAGLDPGRRASVWHTRLRYFDPTRRRAGIPDDCAALVDRMTDDTTRVRLVNTNQLEAREMIVQAGAYAEHTIRVAKMGNTTVTPMGPTLRIKLAPGAGSTLTLTVDRHSRQPTMRFPWDRD